jgi:hypothetical protein
MHSLRGRFLTCLLASSRAPNGKRFHLAGAQWPTNEANSIISDASGDHATNRYTMQARI